jgi:hypothetical protein
MESSHEMVYMVCNDRVPKLDTMHLNTHFGIDKLRCSHSEQHIRSYIIN